MPHPCSLKYATSRVVLRRSSPLWGSYRRGVLLALLLLLRAKLPLHTGNISLLIELLLPQIAQLRRALCRRLQTLQTVL